MTRRLDIEDAASENHPKKGGVPAGIHVPGGWCSKIRKQIHASAGGPDASDSAFKIAPSEAHLKPLKEGLLHAGLPSKAWRHASGELPPPKTGNAICSHQLRRALSSWASLLLCLASLARPPRLLVPSGRRDEHSGNKPRSMRPLCGSQLVPALRAQPHPLHQQATHPPTPTSRSRLPAIPTPTGRRAPPRAYQVTRSKAK